MWHITLKCNITFPNTSRGSLELIKIGLTLSPKRRPFTGARLSKMPSNFPFSSGWGKKNKSSLGADKLDFLIPFKDILEKWHQLTLIAHCASGPAVEALNNGLLVSFCKKLKQCLFISLPSVFFYHIIRR